MRLLLKAQGPPRTCNESKEEEAEKHHLEVRGFGEARAQPVRQPPHLLSRNADVRLMDGSSNVLEDIMAAAQLPSANVTPRKRAFASGDGSDASTDEEGERPIARAVKKEKALHPERLAVMQMSIFESYGKKFRADEIPTLALMARLNSTLGSRVIKKKKKV